MAKLQEVPGGRIPAQEIKTKVERSRDGPKGRKAVRKKKKEQRRGRKFKIKRYSGNGLQETNTKYVNTN